MVMKFLYCIFFVYSKLYLPIFSFLIIDLMIEIDDKYGILNINGCAKLVCTSHFTC